ncbi:uncharacterized protein LOC125940495 isoform X2 [Dermacentor silvarum]|uniref:uncharacterized protein LOC125940495 isoform X2 n=1 Tax=Dermacentor silvarum TaxID=543639 RepID=UPI002100EFFD|nr:uncharacterized protein LOC125940495 isoform X2 [Dermacentor silvarum]
MTTKVFEDVCSKNLALINSYIGGENSNLLEDLNSMKTSFDGKLVTGIGMPANQNLSVIEEGVKRAEWGLSDIHGITDVSITTKNEHEFKHVTRRQPQRQCATARSTWRAQSSCCAS